MLKLFPFLPKEHLNIIRNVHALCYVDMLPIFWTNTWLKMNNKSTTSYIFAIFSFIIVIIIQITSPFNLKNSTQYIFSLVIGIIVGICGFYILNIPFCQKFNKHHLSDDVNICILSLISLLTVNIGFSFFVDNKAPSEINLSAIDIILSIFVIPLFEELFFRKISLRLFNYKQNRVLAIIGIVISSSFFAYFHPDYPLFAFVCGVILSICSLFSKRELSCCFIVHALYNISMYISELLSFKTSFCYYLFPIVEILILISIFFLFFIFERRASNE